MKSVIVTAPNQVELADTPIPKPGPYQALVKTEVACLCNKTDGELVGGHFPVALGHESAGVVQEAVGERKVVKALLTY